MCNLWSGNFDDGKDTNKSVELPAWRFFNAFSTGTLNSSSFADSQSLINQSLATSTAINLCYYTSVIKFIIHKRKLHEEISQIDFNDEESIKIKL